MKRQFKNKNMKLEYCDFLKQETRKAATNLLHYYFLSRKIYTAEIIKYRP